MPGSQAAQGAQQVGPGFAAGHQQQGQLDVRSPTAGCEVANSRGSLGRLQLRRRTKPRTQNGPNDRRSKTRSGGRGFAAPACRLAAVSWPGAGGGAPLRRSPHYALRTAANRLLTTKAKALGGSAVARGARGARGAPVRRQRATQRARLEMKYERAPRAACCASAGRPGDKGHRTQSTEHTGYTATAVQRSAPH
jgi:hypothetical protein